MKAREIKNKIKSVKNIGKITKTMQMVSVAKARKISGLLESSKKYFNEAARIIKDIANCGDIKSDIMEPGKGDKTLFVIIGSSKGLCGAFNVNLGKKIREFMADRNIDIEKVEVITVKKWGKKIASRLGAKIIASFDDIADKPMMEDVDAIRRVAEKGFVKGEYDSVHIFYTKYVNATSFAPEEMRMYPLGDMGICPTDNGNYDVKTGEVSQYEMEPAPSEIFESVIPSLITSVLYYGILESSISEHGARMVAMKSASDNAESLLDDLKLSYNKARQESITREIAEISAGADAV